MCEKARRTFKASKNVWLWFVILKFTYKLKLVLSCEAALLESADFFEGSMVSFEVAGTLAWLLLWARVI